MKTVAIITGNTGVGKSTIAKLLMNTTPESGWYDCDLAWKTNPAFTQKRLKERMIGVAAMSAAAADTYFEAGLQSVFISGVLPGDLHFQNIKNRITTQEVVFKAIWLDCTEDTQRKRLIARDGNDNTFIDISEYLTGSEAIKVDCSSDSPHDVAQKAGEVLSFG